jgi:uncharacterized protein (TIGR02271 family)
MTLIKLKDFYPDSQNNSSNAEDVKDFDVYTQSDEKIGSIDYILVDDQSGRLRYFVVDTGFWIFGKKVLLPVGSTVIKFRDRRVEVKGLTKEQVEDLPNFDDLEKVDYDYEEQVRGTYRPAASATTYDRDSYSYQQEPSLYDLNDRDHQSLKLYEERLIVDKHKQKTGEVSIGKRVETETARVAVPVEKERVVIDRTTPTQGAAVDSNSVDFGNQEAVRMEVYEETPDIHKEAFVREQVNVKKVVEKDTVNAEEQIRREELDLDTQGRSVVDKRR